MNLIAAISFLGLVLAFCNLSDKLGRSSETGTGNSDRPSNASPSKAPDRESVKNDLLGLINEMADASVDGDIVKLSNSTTDDFQLTDVNGKVQSKNEALADVKKERSIKSWTITEADLATLADDTAVMKYLLTINLKNGRSGKARITDTFARRDGKWLLRSEQQTMVR
jgi:hypothetical protein